MAPRFLAPLLLALSACAPVPRPDVPLDPRVASAARPALIPLGPLLAQADARSDPATGAAIAGDLSARAAALRARADALRGRSLIDAATRARMARGIAGAP